MAQNRITTQSNIKISAACLTAHIYITELKSTTTWECQRSVCLASGNSRWIFRILNVARTLTNSTYGIQLSGCVCLSRVVTRTLLLLSFCKSELAVRERVRVRDNNENVFTQNTWHWENNIDYFFVSCAGVRANIKAEKVAHCLVIICQQFGYHSLVCHKEATFFSFFSAFCKFPPFILLCHTFVCIVFYVYLFQPKK